MSGTLAVVSTPEAVEFLERTYAPLLDALRKSTLVEVTRVGEASYVLSLPERNATISWVKRPLPDLLVDVDTFLVETPAGRRLVAARTPVLMLAADLLTATRPPRN